MIARWSVPTRTPTAALSATKMRHGQPRMLQGRRTERRNGVSDSNTMPWSMRPMAYRSPASPPRPSAMTPRSFHVFWPRPPQRTAGLRRLRYGRQGLRLRGEPSGNLGPGRGPDRGYTRWYGRRPKAPRRRLQQRWRADVHGDGRNGIRADGSREGTPVPMPACGMQAEGSQRCPPLPRQDMGEPPGAQPAIRPGAPGKP